MCCEFVPKFLHNEKSSTIKKKVANGQGGPASAQGAPAAAAAATAAGQGQADYSAQWAEYYRRMGKNDEAEAIEKQMATQKVFKQYFNLLI